MKIGKLELSRFEIVATIATLLTVAHVATKRDGIDQTALILLAVAGVCFLIAEIAPLLTGLRKLKVAGLEAEFDRELHRLEEKIVVAEQQASTRKPVQSHTLPPLHKSYVEEYQRIVSSPASNREKIVLGALLAERMLQETVTELELDKSGRVSARSAMQLLVKEGFVTKEEADAFDEFWKVRNTVVHGSLEELSDRQVARLLDLLWRLVRVFG